MPLNPPSQIDRRGLTPKVNFDGTYASEYPNGNKPEGEAPSAITGLAASPGPEQANLSWTPNGSTIKLYRRDDTVAGAFQLVTDQISGSANMYSDQGLVGENDYSYKMVAYNEFGDAPDSNVASVTTGAALGDAYQLAANEYSPSRFPLQWVNPNGDETSRSAFLWSHSEFDYVRRVTVTGGAPPYYFYLDEPVAGVTFTRQSPSWNPYLFLWADLVIDHTQFTSGSKVIPLRCIDQEGTLISLSLTVTVDDDKFRIMHKGVGSPAGSGTLAAPYDDLGDIYTTSASDATHAGKIIVGRGSATNYTIDNFDSANSSLVMNENKPVGWIPYPGESITFSDSANVLVGDLTGGPWVDYYFGPATYEGSDSSAANVKIFSHQSTHDRIVIDHPRFISPSAGTSGNDNEACIYLSNTSFDAHLNISVIDPYAEDLPASPNGFALVDYYGTTGSIVAGGTVVDSNTGNGIWLKARNDKCLFAGIDYYDTTGQSVSKIFYPNQADAGTITPVGLVQFLGCRGYRSSDGLFSDTMLMLGDSNQAWGEVYADRLTLVGRVNSGGGDASTLGDAYIDGCIVINDQADKISGAVSETNCATDTRANIGTYLDGSGNVLTGYANYGTQGADYVAPEAV